MYALANYPVSPVVRSSPTRFQRWCHSTGVTICTQQPTNRQTDKRRRRKNDDTVVRVLNGFALRLGQQPQTILFGVSFSVRLCYLWSANVLLNYVHPNSSVFFYVVGTSMQTCDTNKQTISYRNRKPLRYSHYFMSWK